MVKSRGGVNNLDIIFYNRELYFPPTPLSHAVSQVKWPHGTRLFLYSKTLTLPDCRTCSNTFILCFLFCLVSMVSCSLTWLKCKEYKIYVLCLITNKCFLNTIISKHKHLDIAHHISGTYCTYTVYIFMLPCIQWKMLPHLKLFCKCKKWEWSSLVCVVELV